MTSPGQPLFKNVDCIQVHVPDLQAALTFYCTGLGLKLIWKTDSAIGLGMGDDKTEIIIRTDGRQEVDIKVGSVMDAVRVIEAAGGTVVAGPFDIRIGKCAVIRDPWGNEFVILDATRGTFITDRDGNIVGQKPASD